MNERLAKLEAKVENIERRQAEMTKDVKLILEAINRGAGGMKALWGVISLFGGASILSLFKSFG